MVARNFITGLVLAAVGLPIVICVLIAVGRLLGAMDDAAGALAVERVALGCAVLWIVDLVLLVIVLGVNSLADRNVPPE